MTGVWATVREAYWNRMAFIQTMPSARNEGSNTNRQNRQKSGRTATDTDVNCLSFRLLCGPGGDRTLVQTGQPYALYMLISLLDCRAECGAGTALHNAVSSENFICGMRLPPTISDMLHHTDQEASGKTALG